MGEFTLSGQLTINNECSNVATIYSFFISLQKQKIFQFIYKWYFKITMCKALYRRNMLKR